MGFHRKKILTLAAAALLLVALPLAAYAYLSANSGQLGNSFYPAPEKDPTIQEGFDGENKTNVFVSVGETGYTVYVRAAIVVTWKDESGNVYATKPVVGTDYEIQLNSTDWFEQGGYYYCKQSVASNSNTAVLIHSCKRIGAAAAPEGYKLSIQILSQTIQAAGTTNVGGVPAVTDAWGVYIDANGLLTKDPT